MEEKKVNAPTQRTTPKRDYWDEVKKMWYKFSLNTTSVIGLAIIVVIVLLAIFAPFVAPYPDHNGAVVDFANANKAPCAEYWFGTDTVGRDIMSRMFYAFRGAFTSGLGVVAITVPVGVVLGLIAGYWKEKWFSTLIMRVVDIFLALPPMILALCVCSILKPSLMNSLLAMCVAWWPWYTRLTYSMATSIRNEMFIKSAELLGSSKSHILFKEILPNCIGSILTKATLDMGWIILTGATLSYVGLGEQPPTPALGTMVSNGASYLPAQWWISIFPALGIMVIVLGLNLMGDGVKDMLSDKE